jgi:hypothetical protein
MALMGGIGAEARLPLEGRQDVGLFGEVGGCILLAVPEERLNKLEELLEGVHWFRLGRTGGGRLKVSGLVDLEIEGILEAYEKDLFERYAPEGGQLG